MEVRRSTRILAAILAASFATMSFPVRALAVSLFGDAAQGQMCSLHGGKCRHAAGQACTHTCHLQMPEEKKESPSCPLHAAQHEKAPAPPKSQPSRAKEERSQICHMATDGQIGKARTPDQRTEERASVDAKSGVRVCQITSCAPGDEIASLPGIEPTIACDPVHVSLAGPSSPLVVVRLPSPVSLDTSPPTPPPRS